VRLGSAVRDWGGQVISMELDPVLACVARDMIAWAGLSDVVEVWAGHSEQLVGQLHARRPEHPAVDLAFFDQRGSRFWEDLESLDQLGLLSEEAVIVADNTLKPGAPTFLWHVCAVDGPWETRVVAVKDFGSFGVEDWMSVSRRVQARVQEPGCPEGSREAVRRPPRAVRDLDWEADEMRWKSVDAHVPPEEWRAFARLMEARLAGAEVKPLMGDLASIADWLKSPLTTKGFLQIARRKDARSVKIKKNGTETKFKIRCSTYLYTLVMTDKAKAEKLKQSLPPSLQKKEI
ncbi:unnamed protein product, partial [Polarella glacialis]